MSNHQGPDARYSTNNTNLAACIGALKVPVKPIDPITVIRDAESKTKIVSFWFEEQSTEEFCGAIHQPMVLERHWNNREAFEAGNPTHPLVPMRRALDKLDWLIKAFHQRVGIATSLDPVGYKTPDVAIAAVIMASGHPLLRLDKPNYVFRKIPRRLIEEYDRFQEPGFTETPVALMRRALEARKEWITAAKDVIARVRFTDGICDKDAGRVALIPENASDREVNEALTHLHRP